MNMPRVLNKSCILIGSESGKNFPISLLTAGRMARLLTFCEWNSFNHKRYNPIFLINKLTLDLNLATSDPFYL